MKAACARCDRGGIASASAVPIEAVVLHRHPLLGPREIEPPGRSPIAVDDLVLQVSGIGRPPSIIASRASLSIGDSASAVGQRHQIADRDDAPTPRLLDGSSPQVRHGCKSPLRSAASSVASARGRRRLRATSMAVHAGAVAGRPPIATSGAPSRRCTTRPSAERSREPGGLSTCRSGGFFGVEAEQGGGCPEADRDRHCRSTSRGRVAAVPSVGLAPTVDALPNPFQHYRYSPLLRSRAG